MSNQVTTPLFAGNDEFLKRMERHARKLDSKNKVEAARAAVKALRGVLKLQDLSLRDLDQKLKARLEELQ